MRKIFITILALFSITTMARYKAPLGYQVGTGSYTIPAKRFGVARVNCRATETFSIAGTTVLQANQNSWSTLGSSGLKLSSQSGSYYGSLFTFNSATSSYMPAFSSTTAYSVAVVSQTFVVPEGVTINGCRYYVELYKR